MHDKAMNRKVPPPASTVNAYVDPHARRLVDAINTSPLLVRTVSCCSGHYHKPGLPYVAFRCWGWEFVHFLLTAVTGVNQATRGYTSIRLREIRDDKKIRGAIELGIYPWVIRGVNFGPLVIEEAIPPRRMVRLWWREQEELASMIHECRTWPSREFVALFEQEWGEASAGDARASRPGETLTTRPGRCPAPLFVALPASALERKSWKWHCGRVRDRLSYGGKRNAVATVAARLD